LCKVLKQRYFCYDNPRYRRKIMNPRRDEYIGEARYEQKKAARPTTVWLQNNLLKYTKLTKIVVREGFEPSDKQIFILLVYHPDR
jgi:hypothetical protein